MKLRPFLLWLFFWAAPALGPAQSTSLRFEQLSIEDGLPNPSVIDILQGRQGFMWFGTANGIVRYDGYDMEYFYPAAVGRDNLPERDLPRLYEDKGGNIWLGLANQQARLFRYDPTSGRFIPYLFGPTKKEQPIQVPVSSILEDKLGRLLVGTWGGGLYAADIQKEKEGVAPDKLPYKHFQHVPEDSTSLSNNVISRDMVADGEGNVWLPTDDGLCKFSPGVDRFKSFRFSSENTPAANEISALYLEQPHTLWVGTVVHGLLKFDLETETFIQQYQHQPGAPSSLAHNSVSKILKAKDGKLWLNIIESNSWNSINLLNPLNGQFTPITGYSGTPNSSHFPPVNTMITDYSGNIWVACWQEGVYKYNAGKGAFHFLQPEFFQKNGRRDGRISLPCEDNKGNLWIGTNRMGLIRWNRADNSFDHYVHQPGNPNSLSSNNVHSIAAGANDYLWLGTDTGVEKFDPEAGVFRHYSPFSETPSSVSVETTRSGEVWALSFFKQACRMRSPENGAFTCFPADSGTGRMLGSVVAFEEDNLGNLYFGLNQYGFLRFDPQTEIYEHFLPEYGVHDIHFDRYGNCWLATHSGGLKLFDWQQKRLVHLPEEEQSRIGIARGILEDDDGFLWMKTPTGIVQFDPRERRVKRHFGSSNWLDADELWYGQGTAVKTSTGEMFYSSPNGLLYFHPDSLRIDSTPPKLVLTEFRLFNEKVEPGPDSPLKQAISLAKSVTLPYWQNDLTLAFAALHYKSPRENQYRYWLKGHDETWQGIGAHRTATFTNLAPGNYDFMLQAANSDGAWSKGQELLRITIRSPWFWNGWSITVYILLLIGAVFALYAYLLNRRLAAAETQRILEMSQFKSRFYTNITHEFRTPLTLILGASEKLGDKPGKELEQSQRLIQRQGRHLLNLINQLLSLSKLESNSLPLQEIQADIIPFIKGVAASFDSTAARRGLQLELQFDTDSLLMDFDPEKVQAILANLLSNALKFTPEGGRVQLKVETKPEAGKRKPESGSRQSAKKSHFRLRTSDFLQISVCDTGVGISPVQLPHIFDRFYQVDTSSIREGEGTGIGLALVKELVELMNGQIEVKSQPGKGSTFMATLPIRQSAPRPAAPVTPEGLQEDEEDIQPAGPPLFPDTESIEQPLVLVVEDNPDMRGFIHSLLEGAYRVQMAPDGEAGIQKAMELVPDLVISDVMMPKKDGFELCQALKQDERTSHIPIILLTAKASQEHRIEGLEYGADAYLEKPFNRRELEVRLEQLMALRKTLQQHFGQWPAASVEAAAGHSREAAFLLKVQRLILEKSDDKAFGVTELCLKTGMSRTQLHKKMTTLTGKSTSHFIRSVRLHEAKKLLLTTSLSISEIAFKVGFNDSNFFSTCFKEEFGEAPSRFRKRR